MGPGSATLLALCLVVGLLILVRGHFLAARERAEEEAEARFRYILEQDSLGEDPGAGTEPAAQVHKRSKVIEQLARRIDESRLFNEEEGLSFMDHLDRWLIQAGIRDRWSPSQALATALLIWGLGIGIPLFLALTIGLPVILLVLGVGMAIIYPPLKLHGMIRARQDSIRAEVPFFIQQIYMTLSTGSATIDEAIVRVARTAEEDPYDSILAREFAQAQIEYRLGGRTMEDAIRDVGKRTGVVSVENLCEALIQGVRTGAELDRVLLEYSSQAREMWRQDMRSYKNRKEPMVTLGLVITMFGGFTIFATMLLLDLIEVFQTM